MEGRFFSRESGKGTWIRVMGGTSPSKLEHLKSPLGRGEANEAQGQDTELPHLSRLYVPLSPPVPRSCARLSHPSWEQTVECNHLRQTLSKKLPVWDKIKEKMKKMQRESEVINKRSFKERSRLGEEEERPEERRERRAGQPKKGGVEGSQPLVLFFWPHPQSFFIWDLSKLCQPAAG